jgi:hypothetical protein
VRRWEGRGISLRTVTLLLALSVPVAACTASKPLAELDGEAITAEEVEKTLGAPLARLQEQIYLIKRQKVEALIAERLLAKGGGEAGDLGPGAPGR